MRPDLPLLLLHLQQVEELGAVRGELRRHCPRGFGVHALELRGEVPPTPEEYLERTRRIVLAWKLFQNPSVCF